MVSEEQSTQFYTLHGKLVMIKELCKVPPVGEVAIISKAAVVIPSGSVPVIVLND